MALAPAADLRMTTAELGVIFGVAPGTIRYWVSLDRIDGEQYGRTKRYRFGDIQAAYDRRHAPADAEPALVAS